MRREYKAARYSLVAFALYSISPVSAQDFALTDASLWTMSEPDPVEDATIVVRGGKVISVTADGPVPEGMTAISAENHIVTPGLFNAATQIGLVEAGGASDTRDLASEWEGAGAGFDISYAINGNSVLVDLARADGITGALIHPSKSKKMPFAGLATTLKLHDRFDIVDQSHVGVVAFVGGGSWKQEAGSRAAEWQALREHLLKADEKTNAKADSSRRGQKRSSKDTGRHAPDADMQALQRVAAGEVPLILFTDRESDIRQAISLADDFDIHVIIVGGAQGWRVATQLATAKIPVILSPALNLPNSYDELAARSDNASILAKAGVAIAFGPVGGRIGSNYNAGIALREEAGLAVRNGLPYYEALRAVTTGPNRILGLGEAAGTISPGSDADFVIWDGDPLEPSSLALRVFVEGEEVSVETRQDRLAERYLRRP